MNMMPLCDPFPYIGGLVGDQSWNFWHTRFSTSVDKNTELQPKKHKAWDVKRLVLGQLGCIEAAIASHERLECFLT